MNQTRSGDSFLADAEFEASSTPGTQGQTDHLFGDYIETADAYRTAVAQWVQLSGSKRKAFAATVEDARFRADHAYGLWRKSRQK